MRLHERFSVFWPFHSADHVRELLHPDHLVAVRFEPVYSVRFEAYMDALFERDGQWLVVPMLRVDGASIMVPENPPVTWPARLGAFNGPQIDSIDAKITPWLRSISSGRLVNDEQVRFWRSEPELVDAYERARSLKLMGATPYPQLIREIAPAVYALRLARDGRVALRGPAAASYAAVLSTVSPILDVDCSDFERRWYGGITFGSINLGASYVCYVGPRASAVEARYGVFDDGVVENNERTIECVEPIPSDVMISFDPQDGPIARGFAVSECGVPVRSLTLSEPAVQGGSAGIVRLVVRDEAERFPDSDSDAAESLAVRLRAEGFDAQVTIASHVDLEQADIIHVFGLHHGESMLQLLRDTEERRTPIVVTPYADDRAGEAIAGASGALLIPRVSSDLVMFYDYVGALEKRKISNLARGEWYDGVASALLLRAAGALVVAPSEAAFLRDRLGYFGPTVLAPAFVPLTQPSPDIGSLAGSDDFILLHAPIEPRCNQVFGVLAAQRLGLPLVLLGPVADIEFFRYVNEVSGPLVCQLREETLTPAEIAGLYARARVVADLSWSSRGLHRLARGAAFGAAIVAPSSGYSSEVWSSLGCCVVDPGSLDSIMEGIRTAWDRQPIAAAKLVSATAVLADPFGSLVAALSAYQQASIPAAP
jgi:hypothetical protein